MAVFSLTRAAATEAAGRSMPIRRQCVSTLHSAAWRALGRPDLAEPRSDEFFPDDPDLCVSDAPDDLDDPQWDRGRTQDVTGAQLYQEYHNLRAAQVPTGGWPADVVGWARKWENWKEDEGLVDFSDVIEQAVLNTDHAPTQPRWILADEAQDHSALELSLLRRWATGIDGLYLVGDPYQAVYEWRGCHPEMFSDPRVPISSRVVLDQSYRVPQAVHAAAMEWVRQLSDYQPIEYRPRDEPGHAGRFFDAVWHHPDALMDLIQEETKAGRTVMIQATCSYMVGPTVQMLREHAVPFANPWRTKRGDWNPLGSRSGLTMAARLLALIEPPMENRVWSAAELWTWVEHTKQAGLLRHGAKKRIEQISNKVEDVSNQPLEFNDLLELFEAEALNRLWNVAFPEGDQTIAPVHELKIIEWLMEKILPSKKAVLRYPLEVLKAHGIDALRNNPKVYVGTCHSFKGAEADTVVVFPDLSRRGWIEWLGDGTDGLVRLGYVAMTRARQNLYVCRPKSGKQMELA